MLHKPIMFYFLFLEYKCFTNSADTNETTHSEFGVSSEYILVAWGHYDVAYCDLAVIFLDMLVAQMD